MSKSSGIDVGSLMNSWIRKMGFPVVVVTVIKTPDIDISGKITLKLTQHRFCGDNTKSPQKEPMLWSIPIKGKEVCNRAVTYQPALARNPKPRFLHFG